MNLTVKVLAKMIDHTELKPDAPYSKIEELCKEAMKYGFGAVCVNSCHVPFVSKLLKGTGVQVCSVVGFPLGAMSTDAKAYETKTAVREEATEIDMVMNIGMFKSEKLGWVEEDIAAVVQAAQGRVVKVILETGFLDKDEISKACGLCERAGAHFVKTSTGFGPRGASVEDVQIMKSAVGDRLQIKAAGGIRTYDDARQLIEAGASRLGASRGIDILDGFIST